MNDDRALRDALEAAQAKVASLSKQLAVAKQANRGLDAVHEKLAHLERSSRERFATYEEQLRSHRDRERELRERLDAALSGRATTARSLEDGLRQERARSAATADELARTQRRLAKAEGRLRTLEVQKAKGFTKTRISTLEEELTTARDEISRLKGLVNRGGRRR